MTAVTLVGPRRATFDRQRAIAGIFVMLGLVDIFVFGLLADKGDAVFTFTLTGAAVNVPNLSLAPGPVSRATTFWWGRWGCSRSARVTAICSRQLRL